MKEHHGRHIAQGPPAHLIAERCTRTRGNDFVPGSLAAYKHGRNPYTKTRFYCPHCRLAGVPAEPYTQKAEFRAHVASCVHRQPISRGGGGVPLLAHTQA